MEFVILGLLALRAMTVYEINKALDRGVSLFYNASYGSINAAIGRLLEKGWISGQEKVEKGRNKKIFQLTPPGWQAFHDWLNSDIEAEKVKDPGLTRLYFMGFASAAERIRVLEAHLEKLRHTLDALEYIHLQSTEIETPPDLEDVRRFQLLTLDYGRAFYAFNIAWYEALLTTLKTETSDP
jgi:PadR family transcriptional regulator, regulatory protein AphA